MRSLAAKLMVALMASLAGVFFWLGRENLRVLRANLEDTSIQSGRHMADVVFRSTRHAMLENNRPEQRAVIQSIGAQPSVRRVRIFAKTGAIHYSSNPAEIGQIVDKKAKECAACHESETPVESLNPTRAYRIFEEKGERFLDLIRPIENAPDCSSAACHAHPPAQRILGVLDLSLSLRTVDEALALHERRMLAQVAFFAALIMLVTGLLVWLLLNRPIQKLIAGVRELGSGNLRFRFSTGRKDELGHLAETFNAMAEKVDTANRTLEDRIAQKTRELEQAQEMIIHTERLASLGELSAAVAHELNNPLAGIRTYARLLEKKLAPEKPASDWLQTIQYESRRCGEIVKNLLVFARKQHTEMALADVKTIVDHTSAMVRHRLEMSSIPLVCEIGAVPKVVCDASQIEQVLVAILNNAVDAIGPNNQQGSAIWIRASIRGPGWVDISVSNNGPAIPKEVLPHLFEPFFSTKTAASGVGLGLAVAYGIIKRHGGEIQVETGNLTTFHVLLPLTGTAAEAINQEKQDARGEVLPADRR